MIYCLVIRAMFVFLFSVSGTMFNVIRKMQVFINKLIEVKFDCLYSLYFAYYAYIRLIMCW